MSLEIGFRDDHVDPELREAAERSVASLVERAGERMSAVRYAEAERAKVIDALSASQRRALEDNPEVMQAFDNLRDVPLLDPDSVDAPRLDVPLSTNHSTLGQLLDYAPGLLVPTSGGIEVTVPPNYDFFFSWRDPNGGAPFGAAVGGTQSVSGFVGRDARSGSVPGGANGFVFANAGYGIFLRTNHRVHAIGRSFKRVQYSYSVRAEGFASAITEGWLTFSVWKEGVFVSRNPYRIWRRRVSDGESAMDITEGPHSVHEPSELAFTMDPGHNYIFQVEAAVFSDVSTTLGWAAARSLIKAEILAITIQR